MKRYIVIMLSLFTLGQAYGQKIQNIDLQNGVYRIDIDGVGLKCTPKIFLGISLFFNTNSEQYYLCLQTEKNEVVNFPYNAKMLLKLVDGSIVNLKADYCYINQKTEKSYYPTAYFPISENDLEKIKNGVIKFRTEIIALDKNKHASIEVVDSEFKKDIIGVHIAKSFPFIEEGKSNVHTSAKKMQRQDLNSDF